MTPSREVDDEVEVSGGEYRKMVYLISAVKCMDEMYQDFKAWRTTVALSEGVSVDARIDWRSVAYHCAPQVLVVIAHEKTGNEMEDFPLYAVLPESHQVIQLNGALSVSVKKSDDEKSEVDVQGALNSLRSHVETIDGGKKENAMRQLHILERIMR